MGEAKRRRAAGQGPGKPKPEMSEEDIQRWLAEDAQRLVNELEAAGLTDAEIKHAMRLENLQPVWNPDGKTWSIGFVVDPRVKAVQH